MDYLNPFTFYKSPNFCYIKIFLHIAKKFSAIQLLKNYEKTHSLS